MTDLVNRGRALGLPMTLNARLAEMIHEIEDGPRPLRCQNLEELGELARELGRTGE